MPIKQRVTEDMKTAMRARDARRLSAIRLLLAAIRQREIDGRIELTDDDIIAVVEKMLKQRRDSITQFGAAGRQDLVDAERFEVGVLQSYLPEQLSEAEIAVAIGEALTASGANSIQDLGTVMALLKPKLAARADLGHVSAIVKAKLVG